MGSNYYSYIGMEDCNMDIIMECKNVNYTYPLTDKPQISDLNIKIERGKVYGVIGENGAGKSTVLNCFAILLSRLTWRIISKSSNGRVFTE